MHLIDLDKAKTQMPSLLQLALSGEEVIITENDHPILILKMVHIEKDDKPMFLYRRELKPRRQSGSAKGSISMTDDFDKPLDDFDEYMQ